MAEGGPGQGHPLQAVAREARGVRGPEVGLGHVVARQAGPHTASHGRGAGISARSTSLLSPAVSPARALVIDPAPGVQNWQNRNWLPVQRVVQEEPWQRVCYCRLRLPATPPTSWSLTGGQKPLEPRNYGSGWGEGGRSAARRDQNG